LYNKDGVLVKSFDSCAAAGRFLNVNPTIISNSRINAIKGKSSQVKGYWVSKPGINPSYHPHDTSVATEAARKVNTGKSRPDHSEFMKSHNKKRSKNHVYSIPELENCSREDVVNKYSEYVALQWCKNCDVVITKIMITKSKCFNESHLCWVGKTRKEVGFSYRYVEC
jgi:hypothetical protein